MEPITRFPFTDLPVELAFMILEYAAQPTFDQADLYDARSSALALYFRHVEKFVHALRMQKAYKEKGSDLYFDLLAPILLTASSLALNWTSLDLLVECLEHAWKSRAVAHVVDEYSPPPWNTQTLMLSCTPPTTGPRWERLTDTPQGSAVLGLISHLSTNPYVYDHKSYTTDSCRDYRLPLWMEITPWASFKSLKTVFLPYPRINPSVDSFASILTGINSHVELLTLSASLLRDHYDCIPNKIKAFPQIHPGEECIQSDGTRLKTFDTSFSRESLIDTTRARVQHVYMYVELRPNKLQSSIAMLAPNHHVIFATSLSRLLYDNTYFNYTVST
ncbi:hypothetical protein BDR04DRAFT_1151085 [Suillus decipiens]|nr:hypothetical protein BDR04DRAFT_1151085 [Suillus decipiens]